MYIYWLYTSARPFKWCNLLFYYSPLALNRSYVGFMDDSQMLTIFAHSQPLYRGMYLHVGNSHRFMQISFM